MRKWKLGLLGALVVLSVAATGCLRTSQVFTIYPDGSGKADMKITLMGMMAMQAKGAAAQSGQDPAEQIKEMLDGKVYWKDLKAEDGDAGTYVLSGIGYFDDISEVNTDKGGLTFEKTEDGGYKLVIQNDADPMGGMPGMPGGEGGPEMDPAQKEQMMAMMKGMLAGFEMKVGVTLPGAITSIEGFSAHEHRTAWFTLDEEGVNKMMDEEEKPPTTMLAIAGADAEGVQAEWDAFKKELEEVKKADADGGSSDSGEGDGDMDGDGDGDSEQF